MATADRPNQIPWPPLFYALAVGVGYILGFLLPLPWPDGDLASVLSYAGLFAGAIGIAIDLWAMNQFLSHRTTVFPHKAASALITTGPFAWSRNPIYIAHTLVSLGIALFLSSLWIILLLVPAVWAADRMGVRREEKHLAAKFGSHWQAYAQQVPRWF